MNDNVEDIEIDLVRLFRYLLSKFKIHLILAMIFSSLFFSYKFYKFEFSEVPLDEINKLFTIERVTNLPNGQKKIEKEKVNYKLYKQNFFAKHSEYEAELKNIEFRKQIIGSEISNLKIEEQKQNEYLKTSVLYNLSDSEESYQRDYIFVCTSKLANKNEQSDESSVIDLANEFISGKELIEDVSKQLKIPVDISIRQISELINIKKISKQSFVISTKSGNKTDIEYLKNKVENFYQQFNGMLKNEYQILYTQSYVGKINSDYLSQLKINEDIRLRDITNKIENKKNEIANLQAPVPFEEKLIDLNTYKKISYIKFAIIGIGAGLFFSLCIFGCKYLFDGKLKDSDYLQRLFAIKKLACIHDGNFLPKNTDDEKKLSQAVAFLCKDKSKLSIVSTLIFDDIQEAVKIVEESLLGTQTEVVIRQPFEIKDITGCDAVLILEKLDTTDVVTATSEIKFLKDINCNIIGIAYV